MAVSDVFLVKSIFTGVAKGGIKALGKNFKHWKSYRALYGKEGFAKSGQHVHHWLFEKGGKSGSGLWWKAKNQMWNVVPTKSMVFNGIRYHGNTVHLPMHGKSSVLRLNRIQRTMARVYQTPSWPWAIPSLISFGNK